MTDKPLSKKISAIFTAVAAAAIFAPNNVTVGVDKDVEPAAPTAQVLHPVGTPTENVDRMAISGGNGGVILGGSGISLPTALSIKIGRH